MACFEAFREYNGGLAGLGRAGSRPGSENSITSFRRAVLKFGRQETEGDSANPGQPVLPDWGQLKSIGAQQVFQAIAGPFVCLSYGDSLSVSAACYTIARQITEMTCVVSVVQRRPTEAGAMKILRLLNPKLS